MLVKIKKCKIDISFSINQWIESHMNYIINCTKKQNLHSKELSPYYSHYIDKSCCSLCKKIQMIDINLFPDEIEELNFVDIWKLKVDIWKLKDVNKN